MKNTFNNEEKTESSKFDKSTYVYLIIFIIILVLALVSRFTNNPQTNNVDVGSSQENLKEEMSVLNLLEQLKSNNYDIELNIIADTDVLNAIIRRESLNKELLSITYKGETKNYFRNNYDIYLLTDDNYSLINNVKFYNDYDETFLNIDNIIKLIENSCKTVDLKEENYDIKRYRIKSEKVIDIYNDYNVKNIEPLVDGEIVLNINYDQDKIVSIFINLENFYKNLDKDYKNVEYKMYFDNIKNVDISEYTNTILKNSN